MLKIALTDDHTLFRKSLGLLINSFEGMEIVAEAANGLELLKKLETTEVDILLLDLQMPEMDGFETCIRIKQHYPNIKILILTLMNEAETIEKVFNMGVNGYFTKNTPPKELESAIWDLQNDGFYFEKSLSKVITEISSNSETPSFKKDTVAFTDRELEIIQLTAQGLKSADIANQLFISPKTVNNHKQNIQQKYGFESMMTAVMYCVNHKLITIDLF